MSKKATKYSLPMRLLHWLMAFVILGLIIVGWYMVGMSNDDPLRGTMYFWHKSFGTLAIILIIVRLLVRFKSTVPQMHEKVPEWNKSLANIGQVLLYVGMIIVPISGFLMSNLYGYGVNFFNIINLKLLSKNKELADIFHFIHEYSPYVLLAVVILHAAGVAKHHLFDNYKVLKKII